MKTLHFEVDGMTCGKCSSRVHNALSEVDGLTNISVDHATDRAHVDIPDQAGEADTYAARVVEAIKSSGYSAALLDEVTAHAPSPLQFSVAEIDCARCAERVQNAIAEVGDIGPVEVDAETGEVAVSVPDDFTGSTDQIAERIVSALAAIGYDAERRPAAEPEQKAADEAKVLAFDVDGMTCHKCEERVENAISELGDFAHVDVDHDQDKARVELSEGADADECASRIEDALADIGYPASLADAQRSSETDRADEQDEATPEDATPATRDSESEPAEQAAPQPESERAAPEDEQLEPAAPEESGAEVRVNVGGMTCASCVASVEKALEGLDDVSEVRVNFATERASVRLRDEEADDAALDRIREAIQNVGYDVRDIETEGGEKQTEARSAESPARKERSRMSERRAEEARAWKLRWITGLVLTIPILFLQMGPMWFGFSFSGAAETWRLGILAYLTTIVFGYVGKPYLEGAWKNLKHFRANMDTLIAMGSSAAWGFSMAVAAAALFGMTIGEGEVYFDGAAMILTLISVGKWLESRAKGKAGEAIEALLDLAASTARVRRGDEWAEIPVDQLQRGDEMLVKPGEKIPTDGVIAEGKADIDEAMITGESVPVTRTEGDEVIGSTINTDGRLVVRATKVGGETALAQIIEMVERAQESKADIQRLADKVSSVFVPIIIVIAIITLFGWIAFGAGLSKAVLASVAVLIVACPCALGLATPTAIMVGTGKGANMGILIRDAQALEQARDLSAVIFDKTGTLTTGHMAVTDVRPHGVDEDELLRLSASLEAASEHPIGEAIVEEAEDRDIELSALDDFRSEAGEGVEGTIDGREFRIGKPAWILGDAEADHADEIEAMREEGKTVVALSEGDELLGFVAVRDEIKDESPRTVAWLQKHDVDVWMITGDNEGTAAAVAREIGIDPSRVKANVRPEDKADAVRELQQDGERVVAMVGDGINDAPALAQADLGIAIGTGTDVAIESSNITLVSGDIKGVRRAIDLSRKTYSKIRQNLFWAFVYNTALVPVAAFGYLIPAMAAGAMALSSVSVVSNSLLLKRRKID